MLRKDTIEYKLVSLIGLAGELQTEQLYKLKYSNEYIRKTVSALITNGCIKVHKFDNKKCLRLTSKCKHFLLKHYPERFEAMFTGFNRTNKIRSEENRRIRYHKLAELLILFDVAGVKIFADEKSLMDKVVNGERVGDKVLADYCADENAAEFYTSDELKSSGLFKNARTSRAMGIIYSYPDVYVVYNFMDEFSNMEYKTEYSFFFDAGYIFKHKLRGAHDKNAKMIFIGNNMRLLPNILKAKRYSNKKVLNMGAEVDSIFFLDKSIHAHEQLKYAINTEKQNEIRSFIYGEFGATVKMRYFALTSDRKTLVMDCTNCNPAAIKSIKTPGLDSKNIKILCFDFQLPYIQKYIGKGDNVDYYTYNLSLISETEDTR